MNVVEYIKTDKEIPLSRKSLIHIMLVHNKINEDLTEALKPFDISLQQFNVLRILKGQAGKPANLQTISERMVSKMSNTTRLVDKLIDKGMVSRQVCPSNRRKVEISITNTGLKSLIEINPIVDKTEENLVAKFSVQDLHYMNELLDKF
jgi:DNA-binding MarR family transcriptional regulator